MQKRNSTLALFVCCLLLAPLLGGGNGAYAENDNSTASAASVAYVTPELANPADAASQAVQAGNPSPPTTAEIEKILGQFSSPALAEQRRLYRSARQLLDKAGSKAPGADYRALRNRLDNYPLATYLDYLALRKQTGETSFTRIEKTFPDVEDHPFVDVLKSRRLAYLAARGRWQDYLSVADQVAPNDTFNCHRALALYRQGKQDEALTLATQLWLTPQSMPKACDPVFHLLRQAERIDSALAWQRFLPTFAANEITLARYLARYLQGDKAVAATQLMAWYDQPDQLRKVWPQLVELLDNNTDESTTAGAARGAQLVLLKRLIRTQPKKATQFLASRFRSAESAGLSQVDYDWLSQHSKEYLVQRHALKDYNRLPTIHRQLPGKDSLRSREWLLRSHIARAEWQVLYEAIQQSSDAVRETERWRYWALRARQLSGDLNPSENEALQALSGEASFYGFAAASLLQRELQIAPASYPRSAERLAGIVDNIYLRRAIEHFAYGDQIAARRDWARGTRALDSNELLEAAYLANDLGWHFQAINTAARAKAWRHYAIRFPDIYNEQFQAEAFRYQHAPQWFYATARQESALAPDARSSAGARGLMQILPTTAQQLAKDLQVPYNQSALMNPGFSITLGTAYLDQLYQRYGSRALSSAAYNAGPHRVDSWLKNLKKEIPLDAWIETIRFSETRQYVQNVLSFGAIHATLHDDPAESAAVWPRYSFAEERAQQVKPFKQQVANAR